jgi:hypothetical protein
MSKSDTERVIKWFREHPGSSVQEVRFGLFISNVTGRMSDARAQGIEFVKWRDDKGVFRYRIAEVTTGDTVPMFAEAS